MDLNLNDKLRLVKQLKERRNELTKELKTNEVFKERSEVNKQLKELMDSIVEQQGK